MKSLSLISVLFLGSYAMAQNYVDTNNIPVDLQGNPDVVQIQEPEVVQPSTGVVILNSQTASGTSSAEARTNQVLKNQPTTYVQASPLTESRAEQLRQARQQAEVATEQQIVEKLETSRLEDERRRAQRLFGGKLESEPVQQPSVVYGATAVVARPTVVNVDEEEDNVRKEELEDMKSEILSAVRESNQEKMKLDLAESASNQPIQRPYFGAILGAGEYDAENVQANGAIGFAVGSYLDDYFAIEGNFLYSNYDMDEYWKRDFYKEVDQYDFSMTAKYSILPGRVKPYLAGSVAYIYRNYTDRTDEYYYGSDFADAEEVSSHAVNAGLGFGLDFFVNERFSVGFEYRYSLNVFNNSDSNDFLSRADFREPSNAVPLEEVDYSVLAFTSKIAF